MLHSDCTHFHMCNWGGLWTLLELLIFLKYCWSYLLHNTLVIDVLQVPCSGPMNLTCQLRSSALICLFVLIRWMSATLQTWLDIWLYLVPEFVYFTSKNNCHKSISFFLLLFIHLIQSLSGCKALQALAIHRVALGTVASCFRCTFETKVSQIPWVPARGHTFWALSNHQAGELGKCFQNSQKGIQYVLYLDNVITIISHIQLKKDSVTLYGQ